MPKFKTEGEAEELRGKIKFTLKKIIPLKSNITKEEVKAIKELKKDQERMVLMADKGVCNGGNGERRL